MQGNTDMIQKFALLKRYQAAVEAGREQEFLQRHPRFAQVLQKGQQQAIQQDAPIDPNSGVAQAGDAGAPSEPPAEGEIAAENGVAESLGQISQEEMANAWGPGFAPFDQRAGNGGNRANTGWYDRMFWSPQAIQREQQRRDELGIPYGTPIADQRAAAAAAEQSGGDPNQLPPEEQQKAQANWGGGGQPGQRRGMM